MCIRDSRWTALFPTLQGDLDDQFEDEDMDDLSALDAEADFAEEEIPEMSEDWSSPGLHHSMKKCNAGEPHGSTHMQTFRVR